MPAPITTNREPQRLQQRGRRVIYDGTNRYEFDKTKIPPGMEYGWKRKTIAGMEDTENMVMCEMNGWVPVPASRHPELMGKNATEQQAIVRGGLQLMEQPKEFAQESRELDEFAAHNNLEQQVTRLGLQARQNGAGGIKRTRDVVEIVE